ncbi:CIC11C00000001087 [Sungouiella intermedia]|uniref:CIC11C00000001087 n=1 Tax=Sungouiella intermedia TaxID=45354 RepID=A0A1L0DPY4_9ASCO|nr:CIC11C00000001087 [[Candida] intermedia]
MSSVLENESLAMFFDEDFSAVTYVDALFQSITGSSDKYTRANLAKLSTRLLDLMAHLDYHTGEMSKEIADKILSLKKLSVSVISGAGIDADSTVDETTRLKYYVDSLKNSVEALQGDLEQARKQLDPQEILPDTDPVEVLIQLKKVRINIGKVLQVLQNARKMVGGSENQSTGVDDFQEALNILHDTIRTQAKEGTDSDRKELIQTLEEMKSWSPMFQQFTQFGPVYFKFIMKLEAELKN